MKTHRNNASARSRDFGLRGSGAGKGSAPRHNAAIVAARWSPGFHQTTTGFRIIGPHTMRKVYR